MDDKREPDVIEDEPSKPAEHEDPATPRAEASASVAPTERTIANFAREGRMIT